MKKRLRIFCTVLCMALLLSTAAFATGGFNAMLVTTLWRMDGKPTAAERCPFADVAPGAYCENAVAWAAANKIVDGYGEGRFGPEDPVTREQLASILYRYAVHQGCDVSKAADITGFADCGRISDYAQGALCWANAEGLILGSDNKLMPDESALRCQAAAILHRFDGLRK